MDDGSKTLPVSDQLALMESICEYIRQGCKEHGYEQAGYAAFKMHQRLRLLMVTLTDEQRAAIDGGDA